MDKSRDIRFINPPNILKQKVGAGGIAPELISQAQDLIANSDVDFMPMAKKMIASFEQAVQDAQNVDRENAKECARKLEKIRHTIMQLKANGGMFKYQLVSDIASVSLGFLEDIAMFNDDVFTILDTHTKTLKAVIASNLKGHGGKEGDVLINELVKANKRYFEKYPPEDKKSA